MNIVTNILVHNNVAYYDINSAGSTLLENLNLIPKNYLTKIKNKNVRNVTYGKLLKQKNLQQYIPWLLITYSKLLCFETDGILYTTDSVITKNNITKSALYKLSFFDFKVSWKASIIVIARNKKSYFAKTNNGIIIKGDELPPKLLEKLLQILPYKNWIYTFKQWFQSCNEISYFITNKNNIFTHEGAVEITDSIITQGFMNKINKHIYWIKLLPYFQSLYLFY